MPIMDEGSDYWYVVCDECNASEELLEKEECPTRKDAVARLKALGWQATLQDLICFDCNQSLEEY